MTDDAADTDTYALKASVLPEIDAPDVNYLPPKPIYYRPKIGLIGTGGISDSHLDAYKTAEWDVAAIWNRTRSKAETKADKYCPAARIEDTWQAVLDNSDIDVVDITLHEEHRSPIIEAALRAGKHVLSQKPFVADLDVGEDLVKIAQDNGVNLAVNQNGRWSPHMSWMRNAVQAGHIGDVLSIHVSLHWDHGWTAGTPFDDIGDLVLYDFGVHWFDFVSSIVGKRAKSVFATAAHAKGQKNKSPLLAQASIALDEGQASLVFDGGVPHGPRDTSFIGGSKGSIISDGPDLSSQSITLTTPDGIAKPKLQGLWFNDGFMGAMGELLLAIEENRSPNNNAADNLQSLAMAFAAAHSRATGKSVEIGSARRLPG